MVIPTYFVSFSFIVCRYCSKWRIKCPKTEKRRHPPRYPLTLMAYPTPGKVVPPFFFMKMTAKDVKEITFMPLVTFFNVLERPEKTVRVLQLPPLVRRELIIIIIPTIHRHTRNTSKVSKHYVLRYRNST